MNPRKIATVFRKDTLDAVRDGRIFVAILIPFALAAFYNATYPDEPETPSVTVAHTAAASSLEDGLRASTGDARLSFRAGSPAEVRDLVQNEGANVGIVASQGFDEALGSGRPPDLTVVLPEQPSPEGDLVVSALDPALRALAGQAPPAEIQTQSVRVGEGGSLAAQPEPKQYSIFMLVPVMFLIILISVFAVPVMLAEETEKKTLDALVMAASYREVVVAKALVGLLYVAVALAFMLGITRLSITDPFTFGAAIALLTVTLIGFGLLIGGLFGNANQLNTWSGIFLMPLMVPAVVVNLPNLPEWGEKVLSAFPVSQGMWLMTNAVTGQTVFPNPALSFAVIVAWGVSGYALPMWSLRRRRRLA